MTLYDFFKLLHVITATAWVGGGFVLVFLVSRLALRDDDATLVSAGRRMALAGQRVFIPASLATLILGVAATVTGALWSELWVMLGLAGIAATILIGATQIGPRMAAFEAAYAAEGASRRALALCRDALRIARFDVVLLAVIVADMVLKPTTEDLGLVLVMLLVIAAGGVLFLGLRIGDRVRAA